MLFVMPGPKKTSTRKAKIVFELQLLHPQVDAEFHSDPKAGGITFFDSHRGGWAGLLPLAG